MARVSLIEFLIFLASVGGVVAVGILILVLASRGHLRRR
jgi:hypothetical protein